MKTQPTADTPSRATVPLFDGLGEWTRPVSTTSRDAQRYYDQGMAFLFAFNHDEAIRSFQQAAWFDPRMAMAWWGIALANGPHINNPLVDEAHATAAWEALQMARRWSPQASSVEQDLIAALSRRYASPQPADRTPLDRAYADAMRQVWNDHPRDADVGALFAESLMDLRPWDLWTAEGQPQPGTEEIVAVLEEVIALAPSHPLALHLYIHAVEASPAPELADAAAERLRDLQPGLGHLVHMPTHIDVRRGRWRQAVESNAKAMTADRRYRAISPRQNFYRIYMAHNHHMLAYAAMMCGRSQRAIEAIHQMVTGFPAEWVEANAAVADGFTAMPLEVLIRFGRWDEVLAAPEPPEYLPLARALRHAARGVAFAATDRVDPAVAEQKAFIEAETMVATDARFGNNQATDILAVARHMLAGEILYRQGKVDAALAQLREAVRREDALRYDEPPDWIIPVRHALGATLLAEGRATEAEQVYREDLAKLIDNGWSLYGLSRSLEMQGKTAESERARRKFEQAWIDADISIESSCMCLSGR